jgi:hypothetical protein
LTSEFFGRTKRGNLIIIVAHGVGPMSNLDGVLKAYSWEYKSNRRKRGGRITRSQFLKLESGKYGDVEIIDFKKYYFESPYKYPFIQTLRSSEAMNDLLVKARLGPMAEQYIEAHTKYAREWHRERAGTNPENPFNLPISQEYLDERRNFHIHSSFSISDPYILRFGDAANCPYAVMKNTFEESGYAFAHLISTSSLAHVHHEGNESLCLDVNCHEWGNGVRLVGIKPGEKIITGIHRGPNSYEMIKNNWEELMVPVTHQEMFGFRALMFVDDYVFTQYRKYGARMDTWEPEYVVKSTKKIGDPVLFRTTIGGYHAFFRFDIKEVKQIAPSEANGYYFISKTFP